MPPGTGGAAASSPPGRALSPVSPVPVTLCFFAPSPPPARRQKYVEGPSPAAWEPHAPAAPMASRKAPAGAGSGLAAAGRDRERERAHLELAELGPLLEEKGDQGPTGATSVSPSETPGREGIQSLLSLLAPSSGICPLSH